MSVNVHWKSHSCLSALDSSLVKSSIFFNWPLIKVELFQRTKCISIFVVAWFSLMYRLFNFSFQQIKIFSTLTTVSEHDEAQQQVNFIGKSGRKTNDTMTNTISVIGTRQFSIPKAALITLLIDTYTFCASLLNNWLLFLIYYTCKYVCFLC